MWKTFKGYRVIWGGIEFGERKAYFDLPCWCTYLLQHCRCCVGKEECLWYVAWNFTKYQRQTKEHFECKKWIDANQIKKDKLRKQFHPIPKSSYMNFLQCVTRRPQVRDIAFICSNVIRFQMVMHLIYLGILLLRILRSLG